MAGGSKGCGEAMVRVGTGWQHIWVSSSNDGASCLGSSISLKSLDMCEIRYYCVNVNVG